MDTLGAHEDASTARGEGPNESGEDKAECADGQDGVDTGVEGVDDTPLGVKIGITIAAYFTRFAQIPAHSTAHVEKFYVGRAKVHLFSPVIINGSVNIASGGEEAVVDTHEGGGDN